MRRYSFIVILLLFVTILNAQDYKVYVFMGEDCVISRNYTAELRQIQQSYNDAMFQFVAVFPNAYSTNKTAQDFLHKYQLDYTVQMDKAQLLRRQFEVQLTPEVVVYHATDKTIIYKGRINDLYVSLGRRRPKVTDHNLRVVLDGLSHGKSMNSEWKTAVGCYITAPDHLFEGIPLCSDKKVNY